MRSLLTLSLVAALAHPAFADGPEEPRGTEAPPTVNAPPPAPPPSINITAPPPASGPREVDEVIPNPPKTRAIIVGGIAGGCLLLGAILGGVATARAGEQSGNAAMPTLYTQDVADRGGEGKAMATAAYVFLGIGAVVAIADIVLWVETLRKPRVIKRSLADAFTPAGVRF